MFRKLTIGNLKHRLALTVVAVLLIAVPVAPMVTIASIGGRLPSGLLAATALNSVAIVWISMQTAVLRRTREIGILRSLGASQRFIMVLILAESVLLGL